MLRAGLGAMGLSLLLSGVGETQQIKGERFIRVPDSATVQLVKLADGSNLVGRFIDVSGDPLRFETSSGILTIRRADLREVRETNQRQTRGGEYWPEDPNPTRLFFGPTARSLPDKEADFSSTYLFLLSGAVSIGGHGQIGGGFSVLPLEDFTDNIFFATAKVSVPVNPKAQLAIGAIAGWAGGFDSDIGGGGLGAVYGVGTFGSRDHAFTAGMALPFGEVETNPVILLGGETRLGKRVKLVTENYFVPHSNSCGDFQNGMCVSTTEVAAIFGYGLRIFGDKLSVSLAFLNSSEGGVFPGVPYVDFVIRF
jgi:hypothetical protein